MIICKSDVINFITFFFFIDIIAIFFFNIIFIINYDIILLLELVDFIWE